MPHPSIEQHQSGTLIHLKVQPGARKSGVVGLHGDRLKVALVAPPVDGKANEALIDFLAKALKMPKSAFSILRGEKARMKTVLATGASPEQVSRALNLPSDPEG